MVAAMEGLSYSELRGLPLDELFEVNEQVNRIVKARKQAMSRRWGKR